MKRRYEAIDGLKALSCIGIVAMHVEANAFSHLEGFLYDRFIPSLTNLVFLFMVISAFGMCCGYYDKFVNQKIDISSFYKKRYKKILPFFALLCFLDFVMSPSLDSLYEVFANVTLCFGLIPNANISVIGVGWFLGVVFAFYFLFPFFCFLLSDKKRAWIALIAAYLMNFSCVHYFNADRTSIAHCFVYFMAGGLVFLYKDKLMEIRGIRWIALVGLAFTLCAYYLIDSYTAFNILISVFVLVYAMSVKGMGILNNPFTKMVGAISFEIYLCHMMMFRVVEEANMLNVTGNEYVNYWIVFIIVLVSAGIFAFVAKKLLDRVSDRIGKNK